MECPLMRRLCPAQREIMVHKVSWGDVVALAKCTLAVYYCTVVWHAKPHICAHMDDLMPLPLISILEPGAALRECAWEWMCDRQ